MQDARMYDGVTQGPLRCRVVHSDFVEVLVAGPDDELDEIWDVVRPRGESGWAVAPPGRKDQFDPKNRDGSYDAWFARLPRFVQLSTALNYIEGKVNA